MTWNPQAHDLYAVQHGRDDLYRSWPQYFSRWQSAILPSEEFFRVPDGFDGGWPYYYFDWMAGEEAAEPGVRRRRQEGRRRRQADAAARRLPRPLRPQRPALLPGHAVPGALPPRRLHRLPRLDDPHALLAGRLHRRLRADAGRQAEPANGKCSPTASPASIRSPTPATRPAARWGWPRARTARSTSARASRAGSGRSPIAASATGSARRSSRRWSTRKTGADAHPPAGRAEGRPRRRGLRGRRQALSDLLRRLPPGQRQGRWRSASRRWRRRSWARRQQAAPDLGGAVRPAGRDPGRRQGLQRRHAGQRLPQRRAGLADADLHPPELRQPRAGRQRRRSRRSAGQGSWTPPTSPVPERGLGATPAAAPATPAPTAPADLADARRRRRRADVDARPGPSTGRCDAGRRRSSPARCARCGAGRGCRTAPPEGPRRPPERRRSSSCRSTAGGGTTTPRRRYRRCSGSSTAACGPKGSSPAFRARRFRTTTRSPPASIRATMASLATPWSMPGSPAGSRSAIRDRSAMRRGGAASRCGSPRSDRAAGGGLFWPGSEAAIGGIVRSEWAPTTKACPTGPRRSPAAMARSAAGGAAGPAADYFSDVDDAGHTSARSPVN